jgi:hypothetical protein
MTIAYDQGGPCIELERSLPNEVAAISPFVDKLMLLITKFGCVPEGESDGTRRPRMQQSVLSASVSQTDETVTTGSCGRAITPQA